MSRAMKKLLFLMMVGNFLYSTEPLTASASSQQIIILTQEEIEEILSSKELYAYFGPEVCSIVPDLPKLQKQMSEQTVSCKHLTILCDFIAEGKTTAPVTLIEAAINEALEYLYRNSISIDHQQISRNLEEYY